MGGPLNVKAFPVALARATRNGFLSYGFRRFGPAFARDYLRVAISAHRRWGSVDPGTMDLLGFRVSYLNYSAAFFLLHEIFVNGQYGFDTSSPSPRVIDCGANVGFSTLFFKKLHPRARITAFEPDPRTFAVLERNLAENALGDVQAVPAAVAASAGSATLFTTDGAAGSLDASLEPSLGGSLAHRVETVTLSSVVDGPVDFLKLDIEGAEFGVVRELGDSGRLQDVDQLVIEYHPLAGRPDALPRLVADLESNGFAVAVSASADTPGQGILRAASRRTR